ncbi:unnamed protein product [Arabidopsis thaliana]|uniref:(thale cress) hypothetical protein n=1 Tax=Arabidopsis thaliana TaxID=3702 RepID=A0A178VM56_ARATH|nr:hypothetical protein AXX17_AT3G33930 [Arabidopsis thaliana]CAD5324670.1 unnamed protein product [Arabidopsis thaliana]
MTKQDTISLGMLHSNYYKENTCGDHNHTPTNDETEITSLKNRVNYLEAKVKKLHDLINRLVNSNNDYRRIKCLRWMT